MIEVSNLSFEYPTKRALTDVSLSVPAGAITALVGPNGAGKTTLLRCLAALELPYAGTVRIDGVDTQADPRAVHARVGYLPDFFGLYDDLTVEQCLTFAARAHGLSPSKAGDAVKRTAERVVLSDRLKTKAGELSRGLRQRLAIGQAIVHEPRLLLLDEPASGLDPDARRGLSDLLLGLKAQGITQMVSSHILAELKDYSNHMIIMDEGRVIETVSVREGAGVRIDLAEPHDGLDAFLRSQAGLAVVRADNTSAVVDLTGTDDPARARAGLLRALMDAGFAVSSVTDIADDLEQAYFARVRGPSGAGSAGTASDAG